MQLQVSNFSNLLAATPGLASHAASDSIHPKLVCQSAASCLDCALSIDDQSSRHNVVGIRTGSTGGVQGA